MRAPLFLSGLLCFLLLFSAVEGRAQTLDSLIFGNSASESEHDFQTTETASRIQISAENGKLCRVLNENPQEPNWQGETVTFTLRVRPDGDNYVTFQFWGTDTTPNILVLSFGGRPLGYRHQGDYDILHHGGPAPCPGKFYFITTVLPRSLTDGKSVLTFQLRMDGRIWSYGENFEKFQKNIDGDSIGIYSVHTHTEPCFEPTPELLATCEKAESASETRPAPGSEVLERVVERVNRELLTQLKRPGARTQQEIEFLARGYATPGRPVFRDSSVLGRVVEAADAYFLRALENPDLLFKDPRQYNSDWFGVAPLCEAIRIVNSPALQSALDEPFPGEFPEISSDTSPRSVEIYAELFARFSAELSEKSETCRATRREVWSELIFRSLTSLTQHRRAYTNQTMIIDWNIYRMNRALQLVSASRALPETQALRYLYEAVGLEPWRGSETPNGPEMSEGTDFYEITSQGLTRELGYVGSYGEALDWAALIYLATCERDADGKWLPGDEKIRRQLVKMERARSYFRYPSPDADGYRALRLETVVGWRDTALIGPVMYGSRTGKEGDATLLPFVTQDPASLARFEKMLADNQYFCAVDALLRDGGGLRTSNVLLGIPERYADLKSRIDEKRTTKNTQAENPSENGVFPMCDGTQDVYFADDQAGVIACKRGDEILYASLYWRAYFGVNFLAKVHRITPKFQQIATVRCDARYTPARIDGNAAEIPEPLVYRRQNWTTFGFRPDWGVHYPIRFESLHRGEELPIARIPASVPKFELGKSSFYAGRADEYFLRFGKYDLHLKMKKTK
ncbi:MAG: hypothetical protein Q4C70_09800 [Planctomycetia bacterium]|nr:hypothetical protein [Planctomycetia bacterium]